MWWANQRVSESFGWWKLNFRLINSRYCRSCYVLAGAGEMFWGLSVIILGVLDVVCPEARGRALQAHGSWESAQGVTLGSSYTSEKGS